MVCFEKKNHHARTYVRLLGPCFKTGRLRPFVAKSILNVSSSSATRDLHSGLTLWGWNAPQTHNNHLRTDNKHEGVIPSAWKFDPPNERNPFPHIHHQPKQNSCCPKRSPRWWNQRLPCGHTFSNISSVFLTVIKPAQVSSLCRETMRLLQITYEFSPVLKIHKIFKRKTDAGSPTQ